MLQATNITTKESTIINPTDVYAVTYAGDLVWLNTPAGVFTVTQQQWSNFCLPSVMETK